MRGARIFRSFRVRSRGRQTLKNRILLGSYYLRGNMK